MTSRVMRFFFCNISDIVFNSFVTFPLFGSAASEFVKNHCLLHACAREKKPFIILMSRRKKTCFHFFCFPNFPKVFFPLRVRYNALFGIYMGNILYSQYICERKILNSNLYFPCARAISIKYIARASLSYRADWLFIQMLYMFISIQIEQMQWLRRLWFLLRRAAPFVLSSVLTNRII